MYACVRDVAFSLRGQLPSEVGRVLVFDVLDDGVPAATNKQLPFCGNLLKRIPSVVIHLVSIAWCVDNVEP